MLNYSVFILAFIVILFSSGNSSFAKDSAAKPQPKIEKRIFAGGCFWCMEPPFDKLNGVLSTRSGYSGGRTPNPSYEEVSKGTSGHIEVIEVTYNPDLVSEEKLLDTFWQNIDPYDSKGQFCDKGEQYRPAIFFKNQSDLENIKKHLGKLVSTKKLKEPHHVQLLPEAPFFPAEEYHQDYYTKNPIRYKYYRSRCGRDSRLQEVWGDKGLRP